MAEKIAKIIKINEDDFVLDKEKNPIKITNAFRKNGFKVGDGIKYELTNTLKIIAKVDLEYVNSQDKTEKKSNYNNKNSEKKYNENDTNEKKYIDDNREINLDRDYYPYNFVSLGDPNKTERHEVKKGKFSGKIKCSLKNLTPLFIGGNEENNGECTLITEVEKCSETAEGKKYEKATKYLIPASTIKGELRNIIEVLTRSCIKNVEDKKLSYRLLKRKNTFGIIKSFPNGQNDGCIEGVEIIRIERSLAKKISEDLNKINGNKSAEDNEGFYKIDVNKNKVNDYKCNSFPYKKTIDSIEKFNDLTNKIVACMESAILWIGTEFSRKGKQTYAKILVPNRIIYKFSKSEYEDLKSLIDERNNSKKPLYINKIDIDNGIVFKEEELKKDDTIIFKTNEKKAIDLAFSEVPRLKYKYSPLDLIPEEFKPCTNVDELCFACRLFGTIGDNSKKDKNEGAKKNSLSITSRVFITDVLSLEERDKSKEKELDRLKSLGEPHPTLLRFYLKYGDYNEKYDKGKKVKYEIRGRKFYWHHTNKINAGKNWEKYRNSIETKEDNKTNSKIYFLEPLQKFEFEINFRDLTEEELGILLYSIEVEEGKSLHKIGKAKAYGFGSCEIKIDKCLIETENKYVSFDKNNSFKEYSKEEYTTEFIKKAKDKYSLDSDEREEIIELKYILNRNNILNFSNDKSPFPEIKNSTLKWFVEKKREDYNLPTISNYIEAEKRKGKK